MKKFGRQPMYRSARAVPSSSSSPSSSTAPSRTMGGGSCWCRGGHRRWLSESSSATARAIQIVLIAIAFVMAIVNAFHVLPMFLAMDSDVTTATITARAGSPSSASSSSSSSGGDGMSEQPGGGGGATDAMGMHHGVHKNLLEHKLGLREHMEKLFGKKKDDEPPSPSSSSSSSSTGGGDANDADARNRHVAATATTETNGNVGGGSGSTGHSQSGRDKGRKLARGFSGLPMDRTPALIGAKRGTVECDVDVE